jgi:DNA-binding PadR family transcriptional regulator
LLEVAILGFLKEEPLHGYELKQRLASLTGHARRVSDGALYPAIARLERKGWVTRRKEQGEAAVPRQVLTLTLEGNQELLHRLRTPADMEISDSSQFNILLAFLKYLQPAEQCVVLKRRLKFLEDARSFFQDGNKPVRLVDETDLFRRGMLQIAIETSRVEKQWLRETIDRLTGHE